MSTRHLELHTPIWRSGAVLTLFAAAVVSPASDSSRAVAAGAGYTLDASSLQALPEANADGFRLQAATDLSGTAQAGRLRLQTGTLAVYAGRAELLHADGFED